MKSLYITGYIAGVANDTVTVADFVRFIVVYDSQANGTTPDFTDVVRSTIYDGTQPATQAIDQLNINNRDRFKIICDWRQALAPAPYVMTSKDMWVQKFCKLKNLETIFKADTSTPVVGDIATGSLFLITKMQTTPNANGLTFYGSSRLRFCDV